MSKRPAAGDDKPAIRVGVLYPETRGSGEDDYYTLARQIDHAIGIDLAYVPWPDSWKSVHVLDATGKLEALRELGDGQRLEAAAGQLLAVAPTVVSWACSSGSFLHGLDGAREQVRLISAQVGVPASSTSLAYLEALAALGITRISLGSVYHPLVTDALVEFLAEGGIETVHRIDLDARSDRELASWDRSQLMDIIDKSNTPAAEAVLIPETALHTANYLEGLETRAGKPVLTATQVTFWHVLQLIGRHVPRGGLGAVFRTLAPPMSASLTETTKPNRLSVPPARPGPCH